MSKTIKIIIKQAILCALYVIFTLVFHSISFGYGNYIDIRVSEILILLCFYDKKNMIGLSLGVFIANFFSPLMLFDITFGVCASILSFICINKIRNLYIGAIFPVLINAIIIGMELYLVTNALEAYWVYALYVGLGELIVMTFGVIIFKILEKNKYIYDHILVG